MKKYLKMSLLAVIVTALFFIIGCGGGSGSGVNLLKMLPENTTMLITMDIDKMAKLDYYDEMLKESDEDFKKMPMFKDYNDFVNTVGIDPKKDLHAFTAAMVGEVKTGQTPEYIVLFHLDYDPVKVAKVIADKSQGKMKEEKYNDVIIYNLGEEKAPVLALVAKNIAAMGPLAVVKKAIDLHKGTGKSVLENGKMKSYIDGFNKDAVACFVVSLPASAKAEHEVPMVGKIDLTKAEAVKGYFDYKADIMKSEIALVNKNEAVNKQLVTVLGGLKGMAAMGGPEYGELVNNINVSNTADELILTASVPKALMDKLKTKMKEQVEAAKKEKEEEVAPAAESTESNEAAEEGDETDAPSTETEEEK